MNLGGPARQVLASDPWLQAKGHEVLVLAGEPEPGEGDLRAELSSAGVRVEGVPSLGRRMRPIADRRAGREIRRALEDFGPDVVHTHASKAGALGRRAAWALGIPTLHTFHGHVLEGYFPAPVNLVLRALERGMARRTQRVLAVSHATAADLMRLRIVAPENLHVQLAGLVLEPFLEPAAFEGALRGRLGLGPEDILAGVVGRLAEVKRPLLALRAFARAAERDSRLHLAFVGDGERRPALEALLGSISEDLASRVHLVGAHTRMAPVMQDLDLVLGASRSEGLPLAFVEAGAAALPVVSTPVGGVPELVEHGRTGLLMDGEVGLAAGLLELAGDMDLRLRLGAAARERVLERHSAEALGRGLEGHYRAVLGGGPTGGSQ